MANQILTNCKLYANGYDLSGDTNKLNVSYGAESKDNTVFGATAHSRIAGLKDAKFHHEGFNNGANAQPGDTFIEQVGGSDQTVTVLVDPVDGDIGYFATGFETMYSPIGQQVGEIWAYMVDLEADTDLYRGTIMLPPAPTLTASGNGVIRQLGAVTAAQSVRAALHVFSVAGTGNPSFTATVQSAALVGFGSPTSRLSFTAATTIGAQFLTAAGPITDQFWRVNYAVTGTTPVFGAVVTVSIQ